MQAQIKQDQKRLSTLLLWLGDEFLFLLNRFTEKSRQYSLKIIDAVGKDRRAIQKILNNDIEKLLKQIKSLIEQGTRKLYQVGSKMDGQVIQKQYATIKSMISQANTMVIRVDQWIKKNRQVIQQGKAADFFQLLRISDYPRDLSIRLTANITTLIDQSKNVRTDTETRRKKRRLAFEQQNINLSSGGMSGKDRQMNQRKRNYYRVTDVSVEGRKTDKKDYQMQSNILQNEIGIQDDRKRNSLYPVIDQKIEGRKINKKDYQMQSNILQNEIGIQDDRKRNSLYPVIDQKIEGRKINKRDIQMQSNIPYLSLNRYEVDERVFGSRRNNEKLSFERKVNQNILPVEKKLDLQSGKLNVNILPVEKKLDLQSGKLNVNILPFDRRNNLRISGSQFNEKVEGRSIPKQIVEEQRILPLSFGEITMRELSVRGNDFNRSDNNNNNMANNPFDSLDSDISMIQLIDPEVSTFQMIRQQVSQITRQMKELTEAIKKVESQMMMNEQMVRQNIQTYDKENIDRSQQMRAKIDKLQQFMVKTHESTRDRLDWLTRLINQVQMSVPAITPRPSPQPSPITVTDPINNKQKAVNITTGQILPISIPKPVKRKQEQDVFQQFDSIVSKKKSARVVPNEVSFGQFADYMNESEQTARFGGGGRMGRSRVMEERTQIPLDQLIDSRSNSISFSRIGASRSRDKSFGNSMSRITGLGSSKRRSVLGTARRQLDKQDLKQINEQSGIASVMVDELQQDSVRGVLPQSVTPTRRDTLIRQLQQQIKKPSRLARLGNIGRHFATESAKFGKQFGISLAKDLGSQAIVDFAQQAAAGTMAQLRMIKNSAIDIAKYIYDY